MTPPVGPHLGERVSSLVDGALADDARDRALVHIAGCAECRERGRDGPAAEVPPRRAARRRPCRAR